MGRSRKDRSPLEVEEKKQLIKNYAETITDGWQDVYVEGNHHQQETSKKQKRDFISKRLVEPASNRRPQNKPESCENLQTTLKAEKLFMFRDTRRHTKQP